MALIAGIQVNPSLVALLTQLLGEEIRLSQEDSVFLSNEPADCRERRKQLLVGELDQSPFHYLGHVLGLTHWVKCSFFILC